METKYKHLKKKPTSPIKRLIIAAIFQTKAICILKLNLNCFRIYKFSFFKTIRYTFYNSSRYNLGNNFGNVFFINTLQIKLCFVHFNERPTYMYIQDSK